MSRPRTASAKQKALARSKARQAFEARALAQGIKRRTYRVTDDEHQYLQQQLQAFRNIFRSNDDDK